MRVKSVRRLSGNVKVYDLTVGLYHTVALENGVIVSNCDERCQGKTCGACDYTDLKLRNNYIRAVDDDIDLSTLKTVDQHTQAMRVRVKIHKPADSRFVGNDHWRFLFRRACFRAQTTLGTPYGVAKRTIKFASDEVKYRDWTYGVDYVEFALTRDLTDAELVRFLNQVDVELEQRLSVDGWIRHPVNAVTIRNDVGITYFSVEVDAGIDLIRQRLHWWHTTPDIAMRLKIQGGYFAPASEVVNARDYVEDIWAVRDEHRLLVRMLVRGRPNPYNIVAALMGKQSWLPYAKHPASRIDCFIPTDRTQQDFLRPSCTRCGLGIPVTLLDHPYSLWFCPHCHDIERNIAVLPDGVNHD